MSLDITLRAERGDRCHHCGKGQYSEIVYDANITHNLGTMAFAAGVYKLVWTPVENGYTQAGQIVKGLEDGIERLERFPEMFKTLNPENGWGSYDVFVPWLKRLLEECKSHPEAYLETSR